MRIRWRAFFIVGLLMAAAVAVIVGMGLSESRTNLRPEIRAVLSELAPGGGEEEVRSGAIAVYEGSSHMLREAVLRDKFIDMADRLNRTLGAFEAVIAVEELQQTSSIAGETARVVAELRFEAAITSGELSFLRPKGASGWELLGVHVVIPEPLRDKAEALESQHERVKAPSEVLEQVNSVLERIRDGEGAEVYREASPQFRESVETVERFESLLASQREALGSFARVLAVISSAQNPDKTRARVYALLEYERKKTTGTFEFIKAPEDAVRGKSWVLAHYRIVIPQPLLPKRE